MTTILTIVAVTFAALVVWLVVRVVNRKERWAKWTLAVVIGLPVLYVLSFGPACWMVAVPLPNGGIMRNDIPNPIWLNAYRPLCQGIADRKFGSVFSGLLLSWTKVWIPRGSVASVQMSSDPNHLWMISN